MKHVLRNALIMVTVQVFMSIPWMISGAVVIEKIFDIPGMGGLLLNSIIVQDFPVVQAGLMIIAALTVVCNLISDAVIAISLVSWASYARPVRAKTMSLKNMAFVETGTAFSLTFRYILPNVVPSLIVMVSMSLPAAILSTTTLSFLKLGSQASSPDRGLGPFQGERLHRDGSVAQHFSRGRAGIYGVGLPSAR